MLVPPPDDPQSPALCASFDHAASLGFTLSDEARAEHLCDGTVAKWASRGRAARFEHRSGSQWRTLVDLAGSAVALCSTATRTHWSDRILSVTADSIGGVIDAAPDLSDVTRDFTVELLMVNRGRLLDVLS